MIINDARPTSSGLDPSHKIMAVQDFRHTMQGEAECVSDFIRRAFRIAYNETRELWSVTRKRA